VDKTPSKDDNQSRESMENGDSERPDRPKRPTRLSYILLGIAALAHILFFLPIEGVSTDIPAIGDVSTKEIIAPFSFPIIKTPEELERERETVRLNVPVILVHSGSIKDSAVAEFDSLWDIAQQLSQKNNIPARRDSLEALFPELSQEAINTFFELRRVSDIRTTIVGLLADVYSEGIFSWEFIPPGDTARLFNIKWGKRDEIIPSDRVMTVDVAREKLGEDVADRFRSYPEKGELIFELTSQFVYPNLIPDMELTRANRLKAVENVKSIRGVVLKDQRIVDAHERITEEIHQKLVSLAVAKSGRLATPPVVFSILRVLSRLIFTVMIIGILAHFIARFVPHIWIDSAKFAIVLALVWLPGLLAFVFRLVGWTEFPTPIAFSGALLAILFGSVTAVAATLSAALLVALAGEGSYALLVVLVIQGIVAGITFDKISTRRDSFRPIAYTAIASLIAIGVVDFVSLVEYGGFWIKSVSVVAGSVFGSLLALALLPVFERFVGEVTDFTLVEFSNTNAPVLQQLAIEASGTFHHSIVVSSLSETAAEAIGANPLMAKVGALYHDIGKLTHPEYFSENLSEDNPHSKLSPHMSFLVLSAHVKEGVRLAEVHDLPQPVINIIKEHHGTSVMYYFFELAKSQDPSVTQDAFRYPGPKPQSKEAAIVMLADAVEAQLRSMEETEHKAMKKVIKNVIDNKFAEGQLSECNITTRDLTLISEAFFKIIEGVKHRRPSLSTPQYQADHLERSGHVEL